MKRIALAAMMIAVMAAAVSCQTKTVVGNTITVTWDAPALGAIPVSEVSYEVYVQSYPSGSSVLVGTVATFEQSIVFSAEGSYRLGVRTKRVTGDGTVLFSETSWSDLEGAPAPWYAAYWASPPKVIRVRIK